jgi:TRAP-type C4-dicarboxylate transport system substrate-binding protein
MERKKMKKKSVKILLSVLCVAALILSLAACGGGGGNSGSSGGSGGSSGAQSAKTGIENTGQTFEWTLGTSYNNPVGRPDYNNFGDTVTWFCDLVSEKTNGQVIVTPYFDSLLGSQPELYQQLRENEIQVFIGQPMSTIDSRFGFWSVPGIFSTFDDVESKFSNPDSELYQLADSIMQEQGVSMIGNSIGVMRWYFNSKKEIKVPSDMKGLTTRIYEDKICQTYFEGLCSAVIVPAADTIMALQTGVVDGIDHTPAYAVSNLYEVTKFGTDINWQWTWGGAIAANNDALNELPDDLKESVIEAAREASAKYNTAYRETEKRAKTDLANKGVSVYILTDSDRAEWEAYADSLQANMREIVGADFFDKAMTMVE